jgi:hypothetical protein
VRIVADAGGWATGTRTALVDSGQVRTVRVGVARTKRGGAAVADGRVRLVVTARQGTRRLGRPYRRVVRSSSTFGAPLINRFDGRAGSTRVRVQFTSTTTCQRRVTLRGLVQRADAVEVDLVDEGYAAEAPICGQAFTNHCVEFTLDQQLGTRSVWVATASGLQSPAPRGTLPGSFGPEAWERCVPIAVGGSAAA